MDEKDYFSPLPILPVSRAEKAAIFLATLSAGFPLNVRIWAVCFLEDRSPRCSAGSATPCRDGATQEFYAAMLRDAVLGQSAPDQRFLSLVTRGVCSGSVWPHPGGGRAEWVPERRWGFPVFSAKWVPPNRRGLCPKADGWVRTPLAPPGP